MISNSEADFKYSFAASAETLPVQTTAGVIVTFIYITRLVAELFSNVNSKAKFDLLLAPGSFFLPNVTCIRLYNRAVAAREKKRSWSWSRWPGCRCTDRSRSSWVK